MKNRRHKFFKEKDRNLSVISNMDRALHSLCYAKSGLIIESLIFDEPQDSYYEDLYFTGSRVIGTFGFEIGHGYFGSAARSGFQSKYAIGDIVKVPIKDYNHVAKRFYEPNIKCKYPYTDLRRQVTFEKRKIIDIEIVCDDIGKHKSRVVSIIYHTEEV